jgi:hypothetical protein
MLRPDGGDALRVKELTLLSVMSNFITDEFETRTDTIGNTPKSRGNGMVTEGRLDRFQMNDPFSDVAG